jgi:mono/diheme cytochrome c family protein
MLAMKGKLALGHTDVQEMIAFVRSFQPGRAGAAAGSLAAALAPASAPAPVAQPATSTASPVALAGPAVPPPATAPTQAPTAVSTPAASVPTPTTATAPTNLAAAPLPAALPFAAPTSSSAALAGAPATTAPSARAARLRVAGEFYAVNCLACHGQDGRGTAVRPAMPVIPDFTSREWQTGHENAQMTVSVLEGKGALMPPWRGRVDPALAQDLVAFIRGFGPPDLASASTPPSEFGTRIRQLRQQWQELDRQARALSGP